MPGSLEWLVIVLSLAVLIVLVQVLRLTRRKKKQPQIKIQPAAIKKAETQSASPNEQLTEVEKACLKRLNEVAGKEFNISSRVPLAQLLADKAKDQKINNELLQQTIDFVLFSHEERPASCAIQLQNPANSLLSGQREILEEAGIRVFQLPRKTNYSTVEIRKILTPFLNAPPPSPDEMAATIAIQAFRSCKRCETRMELKRAKAGKHKGHLFWVCGKYPQCPSVELFID